MNKRVRLNGSGSWSLREDLFSIYADLPVSEQKAYIKHLVELDNLDIASDVTLRVQARRKDRLKAASAGKEKIDRAAIIERDGGTCYLCGQKPQGRNLTLDHVIPLARSGSHSADNLRVACRSCNCRKCAKLLPVAV